MFRLGAGLFTARPRQTTSSSIVVGRRLHLFGAVQQDAVEIGSFHPYSSLSVPAQAVFFQYITFAETIKDICRFFLLPRKSTIKFYKNSERFLFILKQYK